MSITNNISRQDAERLDRYVKETSRGLSHIDPKLESELINIYKTHKVQSQRERALSTIISYNITILADIAITVLNGMRGGDRIDPLDLMQVGVATVMKKINTWDPSRKTKMITYYYRDVKTQMQRYIMSNAFSVKQGSVFLQNLAYNISQFKAKYLNEHKTEPSTYIISQELSVSENTVKLCLKTTSIRILQTEEAFDLYTGSSYPDNYSPVDQIIRLIMDRHQLDNDDYNKFMDCLEGATDTLSPRLQNILK